jgi:uncharacterized protein
MIESVPSLDAIVAARVAQRRELDAPVVARALELIRAGHPIPYLARYRRDDVGGLPEEELRSLRDEAESVRELEQRREFILRGLAERQDVPDRTVKRIEKARTRIELEYLYEPYRPPRKTPGSLARERGLLPLAESFLGAEPQDPKVFVDAARGVASEEEALAGAREILAERFAVDPEVRAAMFRAVEKEGTVTAAPPPGRDAIPERFAHLRTYEERLLRVPSHRFLALRRAEKEGAIAIRVAFPDEKVLAAVAQRFYPKEVPEGAKALLDQAAQESLRLMRPAIVEDALREAKEHADREAIEVFRRNLRDLLLYPPAGPHRVLAVDPAPRGAIPVACVDERGQPLDHARLKLLDKDETKAAAAREKILELARTHAIQLVAVGNGQGRRECETALAASLQPLGEDAPPIVVVNEAGAGSYASGPVGRAELPALPVPIRAAVSLARRLVDPLPELVKVEPRHIGVGQYQNDLDAGRLDAALREVVESCVSLVGVDVNRASAQQLAAVCGLSAYVARAIVAHRERHGHLPSRAAVAALPFLTPHAFELAGGFLRVRGGEDPLDVTGVHPAHAPLVARLAERVGAPVAELIGNADLLAGVNVEEIADERFSPATVAGVLAELIQGEADPRPPLELAPRPADLRGAGDLQPGMRLPGRVTNVTNFGAFVDVGVQQDGLVHVSELADYFVRDPTSVVRVGQVVQVRVLGVDAGTGRISLSMKSGQRARRERGQRGERGERGERGDRGSRRPRRPRRDERPREDREGPVPDREETPATAPAEPAAAPPENPVPADMTEEEFMKQKLEELRRRFG